MRILILSASMGMGHVRAAQALEHAFKKIGVTAQIRHEDSLQYTNPAFASLYSKTYIELINKAPELLGWLYHYSDSPWKNENHRLAFERLNTGPLVKLLDDYQPDVVISTHFLPADIISWLICKKKIKCKHMVVVTDFDIHAMWLCHHYSRYFVAIEETKVHLEQLGFDSDRISITGIPADHKFSFVKSKEKMRIKHNLDPERFTILLSAGGFGVGPMDQILQSLSHIQRDVQVVAVCGLNRKLKERLKNGTLNKRKNLNLKVLGYTSEMDELMSASDLIVGKPGGLTAAEALIKGLIFVVIDPIPGQEERNADHLVEEGVAIRCNNLPALAYKIDKLLSDPNRFKQMQEKAILASRPRAAEEIAKQVAEDMLYELNNKEQRICPKNHNCECR